MNCGYSKDFDLSEYEIICTLIRFILFNDSRNSRRVPPKQLGHSYLRTSLEILQMFRTDRCCFITVLKDEGW